MLTADLLDAGNAVLCAVRVPLNDNQYGALCSFVFNLGAGALRESTLLKKLNAGDYVSVPAQMRRWNKAKVNGKKTILAGLVRRRESEGILFQS
jgi:lysozyme